ncbi:MAG TPA: DUF3616 domain-containing protein, partial [Clostridia bacterium]|nr:DUF3616 domain-containing protein [Clostridia bacterium]
MRYSYSIPLFVAVLVSTASAQFSEGNLAVLRLGDGTASLSSASTSAHIDQFTPAGSYLNTITIPDTGSSALTYSGTAVSEGALTRSTDGRYLTLVGYNTSKGLASVASSSTTTVPRGIATVDFDGHYALEATTTQFTGNNIRSGITDGAHNFWAAGAGGMSSSGIAYLGTASVAASVMNVNARVVNVFNENLYFSTGSGTAGIYGFTGTPTTSSTPTLLFATGTSSSPYDFAISPSGDIAYVADDRASVGIQKWLFDGAAWTLSYTLHTG